MKKRIALYHLLVALLLVGAAASCPAQNATQPLTALEAKLQLRESRMVPVTGRSIAVFDVATPRLEIGHRLFRIPEHPAFDSLLTPAVTQRLLDEINRRCETIERDTLLTSDLIWVYRPYFDWLFAEDPHCRIEPMIPAGKMREIRKLRVPAFDLLRIHDTVIVHHSLDAAFRPGDRILAINGIPVETLQQYTYPDRYDTPANLLRHYHFSNVVDSFAFDIERQGERLRLQTSGEIQRRVVLKLQQQRALTLKVFSDAAGACISIPSFYPNNSWLIKELSRQIKKWKAEGITHIILDLRMNPGGYGDRFDELLSLFINRPAIDYLRGARIRCSRATMPLYDFLSGEQMGQNVVLPEGEIVRRVPLQPELFVDGMKYYVLMSRNTGSIAATFCNILQYNQAATLVGEPLLRHAFRYGETVPGRILLPTLLREVGISTIEYDEYTRAVDGVLMPDIAIPYVARDYLSGQDAMLDKLLEIIRKQNNTRHSELRNLTEENRKSSKE